MKGYLKNQDGIFQLAPKVTTVGKEGCDLVIQVLDSSHKNYNANVHIVTLYTYNEQAVWYHYS